MSTKHVLVVMDDFIVQGYLKDMLRVMGIQSDWACRWRVALYHLERGHYDAMLLDENLAWIAFNPANKWVQEIGLGIPIILMCSPAENHHKEYVTYIIEKPVTATLLMEAFDAVFKIDRQEIPPYR